MIERHTTAAWLNTVINHAAVRPWVAPGDERIDLTEAVSDARNILLMGEHGGCLFIEIGPGIYEVHTQVLPAGRGAWTRALSEACAHYLFTRTPAYEIVTRVPEGHVAAKAGALAQGFRHEFTREKEYLFRGALADIHIYGLRIQDWAARAPGMVEDGQWLHRRMYEEMARLGIDEPTHADDENHNRYAGVTLAMARGGQLVKAVLFYNRWVSLARHFRDGKPAHIALVSTDPPVIRFDLGLMRLAGDDIEVIRAC